ncbi:SDR family oxidoreductase [Corynebacterium alimapuense]|uniref:Oxidoreductase n=1 Tax=Corynebacterium alimapuense TaxID=1576874 RepID=A0A3M8K749_9CORY|nr:SDR family oxidoreductase [Corynebacterium alimapuense]RNE48318.1 oxidoreductase [Corynebacterium alimapuense]
MDISAKNVVVITGAGSGLGRTFARALAAAGWSVALIGRRLDRLEETLEGLDPVGDHLPLVCDIADPAAVSLAFDQLISHYGRLDLLVNNAGVPGPTGQLDTVGFEAWEQTLATNLTGTFLCTQQAFAWMSAHGGGRIINNGSIAAHAPRSGTAAYAASKAAVASLTVSTALDGRAYGITATELDIGNAQTDLLGSFTGDEPMFDATEAARLLVTVAALPTGVSVDRVTVTAAGMPYLGRG